MQKAQYYILCKNGLVKVTGYIVELHPLIWSDAWNDTHYCGIHKLNNGKWGLDELNTGLSLTSKEYPTRKEALKDLEEIFTHKLYGLYDTETYKKQAWRFTEKMKEYERRYKYDRTK